MARSLGCDRIVCLCETPTPEILELQREVEASGGEFHAIRSSLQLVALLRTDDILVILVDGLMIAPELARTLACIGDRLRKAVFTLPADHELAHAYPEDFERIDAAHSWAGMAIMRAEHAQQLANLPPDSDVVSLLLRLALQARTEMHEVAVNEGGVDNWALLTDPKAVAEHEQALVEWASPEISWSGPALGLAGLIPRLLAPAGLHRGAAASTGVAILFALSGAALAGYGHDIIGIILAACGVFLANLGRAWKKLSSVLLSKNHGESFTIYFNIVMDILATIILFLSLSGLPPVALSVAVFAIGLARVAGVVARPSVAPFWNDRALHLAMFAICAVYGVLGEALAVFGLAALLQVIISHWREPA